MEITRTQLLGAFMVAGVVHAAVAVAVLWVPTPPGVQAAGLNGIEISLGPSGGAPGGAVSQAAAQASEEAVEPPTETEEVAEEEPVEQETPIEQAEAPEPEVQQAEEVAEQPPVEHQSTEATPVESDLVEATPVTQLAAKPPLEAEELPDVDPTEAEPVAEALPSDEPVPLDKIPDATIAYAVPVKPEVQDVPDEPLEPQEPLDHQVAIEPTETVVAEPPTPDVTPVEKTETQPPVETVAALPPMPKARPVEVVNPKPRKVVDQVAKPVKSQVKPQVKPAAKPQSTEAILAKLTPQKTQAAEPSVAGAGGKSGSKDSLNSGNGNNTKGGGSPGAAKDYMSFLLAWLHKHKEYPREARRRRQEGTAFLYFEMDRDGRVQEHRLQTSSGYRSLDREVMALIRRAQPLPKPPPEVEGAMIKLVVPVQFLIR
ncbi:TonB family protein [Rhodovibrionaceae bacterium A322]